MYTDGHNCDIVSGLIIGHFSQYLKELQAIKCITSDCFTMVKWSKENIKKAITTIFKTLHQCWSTFPPISAKRIITFTFTPLT
jgi:hypothetical protein